MTLHTYVEGYVPTAASREVTTQAIQFTAAVIKKFTTRLKNGYDLKTDNLWLSSQNSLPPPTHSEIQQVKVIETVLFFYSYHTQGNFDARKNCQIDTSSDLTN